MEEGLTVHRDLSWVHRLRSYQEQSQHVPGLRRRIGLAGKLHTLFNCVFLTPGTHTLLTCPDPRDPLLRASVQGTQQLQRVTVSIHVPHTTSPRGAERGKKGLIKSRVSVHLTEPQEAVCITEAMSEWAEGI